MHYNFDFRIHRSGIRGVLECTLQGDIYLMLFSQESSSLDWVTLANAKFRDLFWRLSNPKLILYWELGKISFRMYFANSTSLLRIVILLACEASMLVSSNSFTNRASLPSCRASIAAL